MAAGDFVIRRNAADTTILADTDGGTTDVNWDTAVDNEGAGITYSAGVFSLGETGRFLVMASDQVGTTNTTANERTTTDLQFVLDGTTLREGAGSGYVRRSGGSQEHIPQCIAYVNVASTAGTGDELTIRHTRRDNSAAGDFARIADRSGVSILKLDDTWNFAHYRSSAAFTPSATDNVRNESNIGTTVEEDGTVFARTGNAVTVDTSNPVLVILTHQVDYTDVLSGRTEMQQSIDFDGVELVRGVTQVYGPRGTDDANAASMSSACLIYPDGTGQTLTANLIGREDIDEDWFCELQLIELPSTAETATVERTTAAGDYNAAGADFAFQAAVNVDTAAFTYVAGNANIDVDNTDDYLALANVGNFTDAGIGLGQRAVPAQTFRVNTTDQAHVGNSSYHRANGTADHSHLFTAALLPAVTANDPVTVRHNRIGTITATGVGVGGFSLVRLSTLFGPPSATVTSVDSPLYGDVADEIDVNEDIDVNGTLFAASGNTVYLADASTVAASVREVDVSAAIGTESTTEITLDLASLGATPKADLETLIATDGHSLFLIVDTGTTEAARAITVHRAQAVVLSASPNITTGGVDTTTARLTPPAGLTTGDHDAGRRSDDTNPIPSTTIDGLDYTEDEWAWGFTADAPDGERYLFRIVEADGTVFDAYSVTPAATVAAASGLSATVNDGGTEADAVTTAMELARTVADGGTEADTVTTAMEVARSEADGGTATDSVTTTLSILTTEADAGTAEDAVTTAMGLARLVVDAGTAGDTVSLASALARIVNDGGTAGDTVTTDLVDETGSLTATPADAGTATDAVVLTWAYARTIADGGTEADAATTAMVYARSVVDAGTAGDTVTTDLVDETGSLTATPNDTGTAADEVTIAVVFARLEADGGTAVDAVVASVIHARSVADGGTAGDTVTTDLVDQTGNLTATVNDGGTAADTVSLVWIYARTITDGGTATDAATPVLLGDNELTATPADSGTAADAVVLTWVYLRPVADGGNAADIVTAALGIARAVADAGTSGDTVSILLGKSETVTDGGTATDDETPVLDFSRVPADSGDAGDTLTLTALWSRSTGDSGAAGDTVTLTVGQALSQIVADSGTADDTVGTVLGAILGVPRFTGRADPVVRFAQESGPVVRFTEDEDGSLVFNTTVNP